MESEEHWKATVEALEAVVKDREDRLLKAQRRIGELMEIIQKLEADQRSRKEA